MCVYVIKRSGEKAEFDKSKIINAIKAANDETDSDVKVPDARIEEIAGEIERECLFREDPPSVEEIQDWIEEAIMKAGAYKVAKDYIEYRYVHKLARDKYKDLMDAVDEKLGAKDVQNQNANLDELSFGGRVGETASVIMSKNALDYRVSKMAKDNHLNNEIYIHDLNSYSVGEHNCLSVPFDHLLADGFKLKQVDIRPAGSVSTAFQLVAVIFQIQSLQQFGGVSATHIDWTMVPYVRKSFLKHYRDGLKYISNSAAELKYDSKTVVDVSVEDTYWKNDMPAYRYAIDMTEREVHQAVEALMHNLNSLQSRSGNQLPFSSLNGGTCTLPEGRAVMRELLTCCIEGVGAHGRTSIFPCLIFQCMKGVNRKPGDPNYDLFQLALRSTSIRLYPNYCNVDWSGNAGYDRNDPKTYFSTMGCRTANGYDINAEPGQNPQLKDGRGNICPVTIIMPTLAMEAGRDVDRFMKLLDRKIHEARDMLIERFDWICSQDPAAARFMWDNNTMFGYHPEEGIRSAMKHGTLAIGQIGLAETLELLIGVNQTTDAGMALAKRIEGLFKQRCAEFKQECKLNFGVYYTPAENLCYTAMKKFRAKYGDVGGIMKREYMTNSIHVPVWEHVDLFEKIDIESQLTGYSSAGCITYVEFDSGVKNNLEALETVVNYAMDHDVPYFAINVPADHCENCGYNGDIPDKCPVCGSDVISRLRRVTGYLTGDYKTSFNKGKQAEVADRFRHSEITTDAEYADKRQEEKCATSE